MDRPTPSARDHEARHKEAVAPGSATTRTGARNILIINSEPSYPTKIAISRYFGDSGDAADVKRLAGTVLGCETDGLLHYNQLGTCLVLRKTAQTVLWGRRKHGTTLLTDLVQPINHWLRERVGVIRGKRAVKNRIEKSDAVLAELGYPDLCRHLVRIAGRKPKKLQILDVDGKGGVLEIPPRAHLTPVQKVDKPVLPDGEAEILGIKAMARIIDPTGAVVETLSECVSSAVVEGGRALVRNPHKVAVRSQRAEGLHVIDQDQDQE